MAITINNKIGVVNYITCIEDVEGGKAYMAAGSTIYIGNRYDTVVASSLCGAAMIFTHTDLTVLKLQEVNLTVTVNSL